MPGGRPKGAANKTKRQLLTRLEQLWPDYHPVIEMAKIANDPSADLKLRADMNKEVAQYVEPKRKAIEITGQDGGPLRVIASPVDEEL